ncbi:1-acyl-sn-glycerol-3-phosphate acyltransferase, partial [Arthrospira platensis SPKY1]|nr:1-acyl-sn-glycerol-3-phosphate acyltransferase [Arthrospira platensis SPKY1]
KPVILAANHPTAFIEPCILACWVPKPLHFMVRGDLFLKPLSNWVLRDFNMIPMFRIGDAGVAGVKANYRSVEEASQVLHTHHPVLILAEGSTAHEKRLRPLQKGTARIALGTEDQRPDLGIQLVPVGVNYTYADRFRS